VTQTPRKAPQLAIILALVLSLLSVILPISYAQKSPVTKNGVKRALRNKVLSGKAIIGEIQLYGVNFQLDFADKQEFRRLGKHLGRKGLDDLFAAIDSYYRPDVSRQPSPTPSQLEQPTFRERTEIATVVLGGFGAGYPYSHLESATGIPIRIGDFAPVNLHVTGGKLYADVKVYGDGESPIVVKNNEFVVRPQGWDKNSSQNALEVVDNNLRPVFQLIYKGRAQIQLNGIFAARGRVILASEGTSLVDPRPEAIKAFSLKPIFKYPSWKYPGQYSDEMPPTAKGEGRALSQDVEPPAVERLTYSSESIHSWREDLPYGLMVTIQTNVVIEPTHLKVECNGQIGVADFTLASTGAINVVALKNMQMMVNGSVFELSFDDAFRPQRPVIVTILSATKIKVERVARVH
jgi:hypothetical protein